MKFDDDIISKLDEKIKKIDLEYQAQEAEYERQEIEEQERFKRELADAGIDPTSARFLAHKADDASHKITTKEAPGTQMSARTVNRDTYTRHSNEFLYGDSSELYESKGFKR